MYKKIDDFYKKNSPYKKIKFLTFILAFLVTILLLVFSTTILFYTINSNFCVGHFNYEKGI